MNSNALILDVGVRRKDRRSRGADEDEDMKGWLGRKGGVIWFGPEVFSGSKTSSE